MATRRGTKNGKTAARLHDLERIAADYGDGVAAEKLGHLVALSRATLRTADQVERLHEVLLFLRAYPDDADVLRVAEGAIQSFHERRDLRRHRADLADTGIAGTRIHYAFYWEMARWLVNKCPGRLQIDWEALEDHHAFERLLRLLVLYSETPALDGVHHPPREWIDRLKGESETDAEFLVRRLETLPTDDHGREATFDALFAPMWVDTDAVPSRTHAKLDVGRPPVFQRAPRSRDRPKLKDALRVAPLSEHVVSRAKGQKLVDLARESMVTRLRDLDAIANADARDARLFDGGDGFTFACIGVKPHRRLMLEAVHIFLILKNGVPIGYFQAATLFGASELNYNIFEPYRGAEAAAIYARGAAVVHHYLGSDAFAVDPYQIGHGNPEAIDSGAFWFYEKLGFRPVSPEVERLRLRERRAMQKNSRHRTETQVLEDMSVDYLLFFAGRERANVIGKLMYSEVGHRVTDAIVSRFDGDRVRAAEVCTAEAADLIGEPRGWSKAERLAFTRWAPLVTILPGIDRFSHAERSSLAEVIRAKGSVSEADYVHRFNAHPRLARALAKLARPA